MGSKRIVLSSNNLYVLPWTTRPSAWWTQAGTSTPTTSYHATSTRGGSWGLVGNNARSTHRELEVFGVVISGKKLEDLSTDLINHQCVANREGFMIMYFNIGAGDMYLKNPSSVIRRLNDLFDWSKYGVTVPVPVATAWDRFEVNTGKLMVDKNLGDGKKVRTY
ncbi:unnamed protein product [Linum tenue]|uniref:Uncharacterized protein n=1 Tax=Linum tenue TaxID=586396 RepID=A0AAV0PU74_9ROSI|nr:unnamed protein product [Linum tenue]